MESYLAFRTASGWTETKQKNQHVMECQFVWDAVDRKLAKGSVPLVKLETQGNYVIVALPKNPPDASRTQLIAKTILQRVNQGIGDGALLAEKNMSRDLLWDHGLERELGKAGYYEALASCCNELQSIDAPFDDPLSFGHALHNTAHRTGWDVGWNIGLGIAKDVRTEIEAATPKQTEPTGKQSSP